MALVVASKSNIPSGTAMLAATVTISVWLAVTPTVTVIVLVPLVTVMLAIRLEGSVVEPSVRL